MNKPLKFKRSALSGLAGLTLAIGATVLIPTLAAADDGDTNDAGLASACYNTAFGNPEPSTPGTEVNSENPSGSLLGRTWINYSGLRAFEDDNNRAMGRLTDTPATDITDLTTGGDVVLTHLPAPRSNDVTGVSSTSRAEAIANDDYIEFSFVTDDDFQSADLDWAGFLNRPDTNPAYNVGFVISNDNWATTTDLAEFAVPEDGNVVGGVPASYPHGRFNEKTEYAIEHDTSYTVRLYLWGPDLAGDAFEIDDIYVGFDACVYSLSGNVLNDLTRDGDVNGTGVGAIDGTPLYAVLTDPDGVVIRSVPVNDDGSYDFIGVDNNSDYRITIASTEPEVGSIASPSLPDGWMHTGEDCCDNDGNDGLVDGWLDVSVENASITNANFGIGQIAPGIDLIKSVSSVEDANGNGLTDAGDVVNYAFTVTNTGNVPLTEVAVSDDLAEVSGGPVDLAVDESDGTTFTATYVITVDDLVSGGVENVATATGNSSAGEVSDSSDTGTAPDGSVVDDPATTETESPLGVNDNDANDQGDDPTTVTLSAEPAIGIVKIALTDQFSDVGDVVEYEIVATNTGNVPLSNVTVTDDRATILSCEPAVPVATLNVGESIPCTAESVATPDDVTAGVLVNVADAAGTFGDIEVTAEDDETTKYVAEPSTPTTPPSQGPEAPPTAPTTPPTDGGTLANTGAAVTTLAGFAALLITVGGAMAIGTRYRHRAQG